jgi:UPF0042 nucleotide-binding protein
VAEERSLLEPVKAEADIVIDTTDLNVHQLRDRIVDAFGIDGESGLQVAVSSFGFKHRTPTDADLQFDCRFIPNPHWVDELRPLTGLDAAVRDYVMSQPEAQEFLSHLKAMLTMLLPAYVAEGKSYLTIAMGCTGGQHRAVAMAEQVAKFVSEQGFDPVVTHRELGL